MTAINALKTIAARGKSESARVQAAVALLDRGWGKPLQAMEITSKPVREMTDAELLAIIAGGGAGAADQAVDPEQLN
jgi:hypothetical protein